jgi:hypothetical protein
MRKAPGTEKAEPAQRGERALQGDGRAARVMRSAALLSANRIDKPLTKGLVLTGAM